MKLLDYIILTGRLLVAIKKIVPVDCTKLNSRIVTTLDINIPNLILRYTAFV